MFEGIVFILGVIAGVVHILVTLDVPRRVFHRLVPSRRKRARPPWL